MWDETKQAAFDALRRLEQERALTPEESQALAGLLAELEAEEQRALNPALTRYAQEQAQIASELAHLNAQNSALESLNERYAALLARARAQLDALLREQSVLRAEYRHTLNLPSGIAEGLHNSTRNGYVRN